MEQNSTPFRRLPILVGILNVTPDSFSDGGEFEDGEAAVRKARALVSQGADIVDIGADSTRPGSVCVGHDAEWGRIKDVVREVSTFCAVSVDTHSAKTAALAIRSGATLINDVSGGRDPEMWRVLSHSDASYVVMYSRCPAPHDFSAPGAGDVIGEILAFWESRKRLAEYWSIPPQRLILDPGMGAFLSDNPDTSLTVLKTLPTVLEGTPLFMGVSRKGFLKRGGEKSVRERDPLSCLVGFMLSTKVSSLYLRVHNVQMQRDFLSLSEALR